MSAHLPDEPEVLSRTFAHEKTKPPKRSNALERFVFTRSVDAVIRRKNCRPCHMTKGGNQIYLALSRGQTPSHQVHIPKARELKCTSCTTHDKVTECAHCCTNIPGSTLIFCQPTSQRKLDPGHPPSRGQRL